MTSRLYNKTYLKIKNYIKSLENNINGKYPVKVETMFNKLEEISSHHEDYVKYVWGIIESNEISYKNKVERLRSEIDTLKNLSNEALEIYVSSFASKENKFVVQTAEDLNNDEVE